MPLFYVSEHKCRLTKIVVYKLSGECKTLDMLIKETQEIIKKMFGGKGHCGEFEKPIDKAIELGLVKADSQDK